MPDFDPKKLYAEKREALLEAQSKLDDLVDELQRLGAIIDQWELILLPDETSATNDLQDLGYSSPISISREEWLTYDAFFQAFRLWRQARKDAQAAFEALGDDIEDVELLPETRARRKERHQ